MKAIKENWKLVLIVAAGIVAVIFMCIFGIQGVGLKMRSPLLAVERSYTEKTENGIMVARAMKVH